MPERAVTERFRSPSDKVSEGLHWQGTGRPSSVTAACFRDERHRLGRGLPLPVHLPVHLPEALPRPEGECWLWAVGVGVCPTATSGCRGSHSAGSFHPRLLCVFCVCLWSGSRGSPASTIARSLQTSVPVHPKQPGLPPLAPRPRSRRRYPAARSAAPRRGREVAPPKCFCSVGVGCGNHLERQPVSVGTRQLASHHLGWRVASQTCPSCTNCFSDDEIPS